MTDAHETKHDEAQGHALSYGLLTGIWVGLMACTALTVTVARIDLGYMNVVVAMGVASIKALLVIFFFMHLKYENWIIKGMVLTAFVILAIAIGLTFVDVGYRY